MPNSGANTHRRQLKIKLINTNISLHSVHRPESVNLGYSVSVFQGVVLTVGLACHCKHSACSLRALANGDIDLLAGLVLVGELNST